MGSIKRSFALLRSSKKVFAINRALIYYPFVAALSTVVLIILFAAPFVANVAGLRDTVFSNASKESEWAVIAAGVLFVYCATWITVFVNSAFYIAADAALEGRVTPMKEAFAEAWNHRSVITRWTLLTATVGLILRLIEDRANWIASLVARVIGTAWSLATVFVVPVLVTRDMGPVESVKYSAGLFKKTWGEKVVADVSIGAVLFLSAILLCLIPFAVLVAVTATGSQVWPLVVGAGVVAFVAVVFLIAYYTALQTVFTAALYRYADTGDYVGPYTPEMIQGAYRRK